MGSFPHSPFPKMPNSPPFIALTTTELAEANPLSIALRGLAPVGS